MVDGTLVAGDALVVDGTQEGGDSQDPSTKDHSQCRNILMR